MCGRVSVAVSYDDMIKIIRQEYNIEDTSLDDYNLPRYNVAPGQNLISIISDGNKYRSGKLRWGLVPFWAKDDKNGYKMINAKAETLSKKVSFKSSFKNKRCIILVDGFYEWKKEKNTNIPMRITLKEKSVFSLAGLYSSYTKDDGSKLHTCTIITTTPNDIMNPVHNRMPVILTKASEKIWLNPKEKDLHLLSSLLTPFDSNKMNVYPVSSIVNSYKNDVKECIIQI